MSNQKQTCDQCRFFADHRDTTEHGRCHANPPVIVGAVVKELVRQSYDPAVAARKASAVPMVKPDDFACRFFVVKGAK